MRGLDHVVCCYIADVVGCLWCSCCAVSAPVIIQLCMHASAGLPTHCGSKIHSLQYHVAANVRYLYVL
jgi:hypothetical protein